MMLREGAGVIVVLESAKDSCERYTFGLICFKYPEGF